MAAPTLSELRRQLDSRATSARAVAEAAIAQAKRKDALHVFNSIDEERILQQAAAADERLQRGERGALLGIPVVMKDNILVKGEPCTCSSKILEGFIAPYDATVTKKLAAAGAILFGRANLDEFAMGSSTENSATGPTKNPWNPGYVPGGSSGGSAAAVAAGIAPLSLGSDTGGSIRQPAAFCGLVGMKPTYGRVSRYGLVAFASSLDQIGPFSLTVEDCARALEAISGVDTYDATSVDVAVPKYTEALTRGVKGLRIGVPKEYFIDGIDPEVRAAVEVALKVFEAEGAKLVPISLPHTEYALGTYYILAPAEASSNLARFDGVRYGFRAEGVDDLRQMYMATRAQGFGSEVKRRIMIGSYVLSAGFFDAFYVRAQKVRALIQRDFTKVFDSACDVIVSPTAPTAAFPFGAKADPLTMYLNDVFTIPANLAGIPGISIPCGFTKAGLPIGMQLLGKAWDEETLFAASAAYERKTEWHMRRAS